jgi:hypothetical protein
MTNDELTELCREAYEALCWCGGSNDFQTGGFAAEGWERVVRPVIAKLRNVPMYPNPDPRNVSVG